MENECTSPGSNANYESKLGGRELHYSNDSFTSNEAQEQGTPEANDISAEECDKFREVLENRFSSVDNSPKHGLVRKDSQSSIEREIAALNQEMEQIQIECQEIVEAHARERQRVQNDIRNEPFRSPRMVPRMGTKLDYMKPAHSHEVHSNGHGGDIWIRNEPLAHFMKDTPKPKEIKRLSVEEKEKDTSTTSAYNTGDSCRSTPLTLELNQVSDEVTKGQKGTLLSLAHPKPSYSDSEKRVGLPSQHSSNKSKEWNSDGDSRNKGVPKSQSNGSFSEKTSQTPQGGIPANEQTESLQELYAQYADVMYTNRANLEHTIMVQQKLFQQQLMQRAHSHDSPDNSMSQSLDRRSEPSTSELPLPQTPTSSGPQMEWVVKRRADGSRYITRRPVRNRMLKERAKKVAEERSGMTTDDDAVSELKVGRYWSKEDRKRHLEKAKDYKRKKEQIKQRMETVKEGDEGKKEPNIVELSHRKMMKHKNKKVFDDFTTVQEMLAHGSREPQGKNCNPLLSVTTV